MTIKESHYQFLLNKDRIQSLATEDFNRAEIDWLLNEAQLIFLKQRTNWSSNRQQRGFEGNQKRIDDLSTLVIKFPLQPAITPTLDDGIYELPLSSLAYTYFQLISIKADVEIADGCEKSIPLKFIQHDDYIDALRDPFNKPSEAFIPFNYGRSSAGLGTSIYIYPGDYTISSVYPEYIKYPSRVSHGNYTYIDGNVYPESTFEFPEHTHKEIIDIACQIAALNIESPEYIQLKSQKVFIHE